MNEITVCRKGKYGRRWKREVLPVPFRLFSLNCLSQEAASGHLCQSISLFIEERHKRERHRKAKDLMHITNHLQNSSLQRRPRDLMEMQQQGSPSV